MKTAMERVERIIQDRTEERAREKADLLQQITQAGSTEAYLGENWPHLARLAKDLTPEEFTEVIGASDMGEIERHLERCDKCEDGGGCWGGWLFREDPYQGRSIIIRNGLLIGKECGKYHKYAERTALGGSGVGKRFLDCSLDSYIPATNEQKKALAAIEAYADGLLTEDGVTDTGLLIVGPVGTGKTHLAVSILREAHRLGLGIAFAQVPQVLADIRAGIGRGDEEATAQIDMYSEVSVLALDDLGSERVTDWVHEQLFLIINRRYEEMLPTIITSNDSLEILEEHLGKRIASRLAGMCIGVALDGPDYRLGGEQ